eukprot:COSAG06_NODE_67660_length_251_cov_0.684211_1_plen_34_part_01
MILAADLGATWRRLLAGATRWPDFAELLTQPATM